MRAGLKGSSAFVRLASSLEEAITEALRGSIDWQDAVWVEHEYHWMPFRDYVRRVGSGKKFKR